MRRRDLVKLERAEDKAWKKMRREFDKVYKQIKAPGASIPSFKPYMKATQAYLDANEALDKARQG